MRKEDCYQLGHISRLHGYKGEVVAFFDTDQPQRYHNLESVFVDNRGELVPFFIEALATNSKGHFIIQFEDADLDMANGLIGSELYLPLEFLPKLSGKQFYFHEVQGFTLIDTTEGVLGICEEIIDSTAQPLFKIMDDDLELLVPAVDDYIQKIDREKKEIHVTCPPGLVDVYRNKES